MAEPSKKVVAQRDAIINAFLKEVDKQVQKLDPRLEKANQVIEYENDPNKREAYMASRDVLYYLRVRLQLARACFTNAMGGDKNEIPCARCMGLIDDKGMEELWNETQQESTQ